MIKKLYYAQKDLSEFGCFIDGEGVYNSATLNVNKYNIFGNSGEYLSTNGYFENVEITYHCFIRDDFQTNLQRLKEWLFNPTNQGYQYIETSYEPLYFRLGAIYEGLEVKKFVDKVCYFDITFDCMPMKYLKNGDKKITFAELRDNGFKLTNSHAFASVPEIVLAKEGGFPRGTDTTINFNDSSIVTFHGNNLSVDSYGYLFDNFNKQIVQINSTFGYASVAYDIFGNYPTLKVGTNTISVSDNIDFDLSYIVPLWWTI